MLYSELELQHILSYMSEFGFKYACRAGTLTPLRMQSANVLQFAKSQASERHFPGGAPHGSSLMHILDIGELRYFPKINLDFEILDLHRFSQEDYLQIMREGEEAGVEEDFLRFISNEILLQDVEKLRLCRAGIYFQQGYTANQWECFKGSVSTPPTCLADNRIRAASELCIDAHDALAVLGTCDTSLSKVTSVNTKHYGSETIR